MAIIGTGVAITFQSGLLGEILDCQRQGMERASIPTSHFGTTGNMTFMPGALVDPGTYVVQVAFDPTDNPDTFMGAVTETVTVAWTDVGGTTWANDGFMQSYSGSVPFEERIVATFTIKLSGATTVA